LDIKGGVEAPHEGQLGTSQTSPQRHTICHEQYKNIGRCTIILREA
jgi:hypothetical protein